MSTQSDVELNIALVNGEHQKAVGTLAARWFKSADNEAAMSSLTSLGKTINSWAQRGRDALKAGATKMPPEKWSGWVRAGRVHIDGIHALVELGDKSSLKDIADAVVKAAKDAPKQIASATKEVAGAVGSTAAAAVKPLLLPLGVIAAIAIALLIALHYAGVL